jgi:muramoyltetrapeptide carboxypeptidase
LRQGDLAYLFAPCGAVREPYRSAGIALLAAAGYAVATGASLDAAPSPFAAGPAALRVADWQRGLDLGAAALLPARGGYGGIHLLDAAPWETTAAVAPLWIGGSDCTFLQTALLQRIGLGSFYGAAPCGQLAEPGEASSRAAFLAALDGSLGSSITLPGATVLRDGQPSGELRGGCLSILAALAGTSDQLDARGAILILEDTGEHPFRIERLLRQLLRCGSLDGARGLLFNTMPGCVDRSGDPALVRSVIADFVAEVDLPAWIDCPIGHGSGVLPLPLGTPVQMRDGTIELLESPWAP